MSLLKAHGFFGRTTVALWFLLCQLWFQAEASRDSLLVKLKSSHGIEYIRTLNLLSWENRVDSPDLAFRQALRAVVLSRKGRYAAGEAMAWKTLAWVSFARGRVRQSEDYQAVALRMADRSGDPATLKSVCTGIGRIKMRQKNYPEALGYFLRAERTRGRAGLKPDPDLYERLADNYKNLNDNAQAVNYYRLAADLYTREGDPNGRLPFILGYLAILYNEWGWNEQALECFSRSLRLHLKTGDSIAAAFTYCNMADVYSRTLGHRKAIEYTRQALEIFRRKHDHGGMGYALNGLGTSCYNLGIPDTALDYYRQSVAEHAIAGALEHMSFTLANIGDILVREAKYQEAFPYLQNATRYADSSKSDLARSAALASLGKYYQLTGNYPGSLSAALESQEIALARGFKQLMADNYRTLAETNERSGNYARALEYMKEYLALHDSLVSEKNRKVAAETEARYSLENKELMIDRLTRENELKRETIRSKNRFTFLIILSSLAIFGMLSLVIRFYYMKVKAFEQTVKLTVEQMKLENAAAEALEPARPDQSTEPGNASAETVPDPDEAGLLLIGRLKLLVENEKLYLDPDLSMSEVADRLRTNTTYLSRAVNDILEKNFPAYVNELRIREAQRLLADRKYANRSIEGIALMSGFRSKSAFNDAFRRFTGMTPSFFQRSALKV